MHLKSSQLLNISSNSPPSRDAETVDSQASVSATPFWGRLRQRFFSIPLEETTFAKRGFRKPDRQVRQHLETVGPAFLLGYHAAIKNDNPDILVPQLNAVEAEWRGFAFEGAAMGLAILDILTPGKKHRLQEFLAGAGDAHTYMVHIGAGWILGRLPLNVEKYLNQLDPLLKWLAIDGYGFHEGFFHSSRYIKRREVCKKLSGYARRVFDQGLGRSLWFVEGADVTCISQTINQFPSIRQADLWSGVGLACAYAGGVDGTVIEMLRSAVGSDRPQLAQGAAFAAKARLRALNLTSHTELACQLLCGMSAEAAAKVTDVALENLPTDGEEPAYEVWRQRIQAQFVARETNA